MLERAAEGRYSAWSLPETPPAVRQSLRLDHGPELHSCRPSVDRLFTSLARELGSAAVGCLLTGVGPDGAGGLLAMRNAGAFTIAQDEESSVVFGMPQAAIRLGAARSILPLGRVAGVLRRLARRAAPEVGR